MHFFLSSCKREGTWQINKKYLVPTGPGMQSVIVPRIEAILLINKQSKEKEQNQTCLWHFFTNHSVSCSRPASVPLTASVW